MAVTGSVMDEYSLDYFIKVKPVTFIQQILLKLSTLLFIPVLVFDAICTKQDMNVLTKNKHKMQGVINASTSNKISMQDIKDLSKKVGCTVNDIMMCATSTAFKNYFKNKGDPLGTLDDKDSKSFINAFMPANIRFQMYARKEDVTAENIFACLPMKIPLVSTMKDAYEPMKKLTTWLKNSTPYVYLLYLIAYYSSIYLPRFVTRFVLMDTTEKFSVGFSNVPGPVKSWWKTNTKGEKCFGRWCQTYVCLSGRIGICVSCISYVDNYKISVTAD